MATGGKCNLFLFKVKRRKFARGRITMLYFFTTERLGARDTVVITHAGVGGLDASTHT